MSKIKVAICTVFSGGGHIAYSEYLEEELAKSTKFSSSSFSYETEVFNKGNDSEIRSSGPIFNFLYHYVYGEIAALTIPKVIKAYEKFILQEKPQIVIATHWGVAACLAFIKAVRKLNFLLINAIPDYGLPTNVLLPENKLLQADAYLLSGENGKQQMLKRYYVPEQQVLVLDFEARQAFMQTKADFPLKISAKEQLLKSQPAFAGADKTKKWILLSSGAGGMVQKSKKLLNYLIKKRLTGYEIIVICGKNRKFFQYLTQKRAQQSWQMIIPLAWIPAQEYALVQRACDLAVVSSLGISTMHELIACETYPVIVYRHRQAQENGNLAELLKQGLGYYLPQAEKIYQLLCQHKFPELKRPLQDLNLQYRHFESGLLALYQSSAPFHKLRYRRRQLLNPLRWPFLLFRLFCNFYLASYKIYYRLGRQLT